MVSCDHTANFILRRNAYFFIFIAIHSPPIVFVSNAPSARLPAVTRILPGRREAFGAQICAYIDYPFMCGCMDIQTCPSLTSQGVLRRQRHSCERASLRSSQVILRCLYREVQNADVARAPSVFERTLAPPVSCTT